MRSILEQAIVHLLQEDHEKAQALFHKFMVERARQIHESLRSGEDALMESFDEINTDEMFEEGDLTGLEDENTDDASAEVPSMGDDSTAAPEFGSDDSADSEPSFGGETDETAPEGDEFGGEDAGMEGEGSTEDRLADLESQLEDLQAEFESMMGGDSAEGDLDGAAGDIEGGMDDMGGDLGGDIAGDDTMGGEVDGDMDSSETGDMADSMEDDMEQAPVHEADESEEENEDETLEEESFDDITESVISELEKVMVSMTDGKEIAAGKSFSQNNKSPALQKKPNPMSDGKPVTIKATEHKGFERETAPSVKDMKARKNTKKKADAGQSSVSKEGDKSALINKTPGAE
ncbi:MAG: hypothetical protein EOP83_18975, partial [Verrucomicrobiaceae bacterium]